MNFQGKGKPNIFGRPGNSASEMYKGQKLHFAGMNWKSKIGLLAFITLASTVLAKIANYSPIIGGAIGLTLCLAVVALLTATDVLKILAVLVVYAVITAPVGTFYTKIAQHNSNIAVGDVIGGSLALIIAMLFAVWIAIRFSRGEVWFTIALVAGSVILLGIPLALIVPDLGLNAARISMALVLLFRCGGWAWISGSIGLLFSGKEDVAVVRKVESDDLAAIEAWNQRSKAEQATAKILDSLDNEYAVFHDIHIKNSQNALGHLVIGPGGCSLIASVYSKGPLKENPKSGISLPKIPLDKSVGVLMAQRETLAKILHCNERDLAIVLVIHGLDEQELRKPLAIFTQDDLTLPSGQVIFVGPDMLSREVAPGLELWSKVKVKQTIQRAKMKLRPAMAPNLVAGKEVATPRLSALDSDGHLKHDTKPSNLIPSWMSFGVAVNIATSQGILADLRIAGNPVHDEFGDMVVPVCVEEEWVISQNKGRAPKSYPWPIASVLPA